MATGHSKAANRQSRYSSGISDSRLEHPGRSISGSVALVGFGIDSAIESFSGAVLLWRLHAEKNGQKADLLDRKALKLVGTGFLLLAVYVAFDAISTLV